MKLDVLYEISELKRMVNNLLTYSKVTFVDIDKCRVKVAIGDESESDLLPVLSARSSAGDKEVWLPEKGDQVAILALLGDINGGVVVGSLLKAGDSPKKATWFKEFSDGTTIEYDKKTHNLDIKIADGGAVAIKAPDGTVSVDCKESSVTADKATVTGKSSVVVRSDTKVDLVATNVTVDGIMKVTGAASFDATVAVTGALSSASVATGGLAAGGGSSDLTIGQIKGDLVVGGDVEAGGVSLKGHKHAYQGPLHKGDPADTSEPGGSI